MHLSEAPIKETYYVGKVETDGKTKRHLESLGILFGQKIYKFDSIRGDIIIKVGDGKLALNKDLAKCISVNKGKEAAYEN